MITNNKIKGKALEHTLKNRRYPIFKSYFRALKLNDKSNYFNMDYFNNNIFSNSKSGGLNKMIGTHKTTITNQITPTYCVTKICYHNTIVCEFDNKKINLNTGGWFTSTTIKRMNQASKQFNLGFKVFQKDYSFLCQMENKIFAFSNGKLTLPRANKSH